MGTGTPTSGIVDTIDDLFVTDDLEVFDDVHVGDTLFIGTNPSTSNDSIFMNDGTERIFWRGLADRFEMTSDLGIQHDLFVGTFASNDDDTITFDLPSTPQTITWDDIETRFEISNEVLTSGPICAGCSTEANVVTYNRMNAGISDHGMFGTSDLYVSDDLEANDDLFVDGKLTVAGLVDPPAITFSVETHDSKKQLATDVEDHEEVMVYWNTENHQMEVYVLAEDAFYTFDGTPVPYKSYR